MALRKVMKGERAARVAPKQLKAIQVFTVMLESGQEALGMVSHEGQIYFTSATGWIPFDMTEQEASNNEGV